VAATLQPLKGQQAVRQQGHASNVEVFAPELHHRGVRTFVPGNAQYGGRNSFIVVMSEWGSAQDTNGRARAARMVLLNFA
jgi:hypothetical protein